MRPSTTTGVALRSFGTPLLNDYEETVRRLYDSGYRVLDFAFVCHNYSNYILRYDDWQQRIDSIANLAAKLGIKAKDELQDAILRLTYENGCYLMKINNEALAKLNGDKE